MASHPQRGASDTPPAEEQGSQHAAAAIRRTASPPKNNDGRASICLGAGSAAAATKDDGGASCSYTTVDPEGHHRPLLGGRGAGIPDAVARARIGVDDAREPAALEQQREREGQPLCCRGYECRARRVGRHDRARPGRAAPVEHRPTVWAGCLPTLPETRPAYRLDGNSPMDLHRRVRRRSLRSRQSGTRSPMGVSRTGYLYY